MTECRRWGLFRWTVWHERRRHPHDQSFATPGYLSEPQYPPLAQIRFEERVGSHAGWAACTQPFLASVRLEAVHPIIARWS